MTTPDPIRHAIELIATGSPALHTHDSGEHRCAQCHAYIDLAREALGQEKWPAASRTGVGKP